MITAAFIGQNDVIRATPGQGEPVASSAVGSGSEPGMAAKCFLEIEGFSCMPRQLFGRAHPLGFRGRSIDSART